MRISNRVWSLLLTICLLISGLSLQLPAQAAEASAEQQQRLVSWYQPNGLKRAADTIILSAAD